MVKINRKVEYSLMILKHMADNKDSRDRFSARDMCDQYSIPFDTVSKVLQVLAKNEIVDSIKGINGGYSLTKDLKSINYLSLNEIIEGKTYLKNCSDQNCMLLGNCNISGPITNLNEYLLNLFKEISIHDLLYKNMNHINIKEDNLLSEARS